MPLKPDSLKPWGGQMINPNSANTFTWRSDGSQAAYYIEYARNISGGAVSNTGWVSSSVSEHVFAADTFTDTWEYKWRVKIRNSTGIESDYADWVIFKANYQVPLIITFPANDMDVITSIPIYQHSFATEYGYGQYSYQYVIHTGTLWNQIDAMTGTQQDAKTWDELEIIGGVDIWDSGEVVSSVSSVEQPAGCYINGQHWYKAQVTIKDTINQTYLSEIRTFFFDMSDVPLTPTITAASDSANGRNTITITNPTPGPGQASASYNRLYRRLLDNTWELIGDNITGGTGYDTTCRSSKNEEYAVSAVSAAGFESAKSTSAFATCQLDSYWFTNLTTLATLKLRAEPRWGKMQSERDRFEEIGADAVYPSVCYGSKRVYRGTFQAIVLKPDSPTTWPQYITQIKQIIGAGNNIIFRTPFGDTLKIDIYDLKVDPEDRIGQYRRVTFSMIEIEDTTPVGTLTYDTPGETISNFWIIDPVAGTGVELIAEPKWGTISFERRRFENFGLNQAMPSVAYANKNAVRSGFSGMVLQPAVGTLSDAITKLRELVDGSTKKKLQFITPYGDQYLVDVYGFSYELIDRIGKARRVSFEFVEVGEVV